MTKLFEALNPARAAKGMYWDRAWSLVQGCTPVSAACDHCWAAAQAHMRASNPNAKVAAANAGLTCKDPTLYYKRFRVECGAVWDAEAAMEEGNEAERSAL